MAKSQSKILNLLLWLPAVLALFISGYGVAIGNASSVAGIQVTVYNNFGYNASPPLPDQSGRPVVGTTTVNNIEQNFDQSPLFGMYEDFIVKYEGYITSPITGNVTFLPAADDGTKFYLNEILIDNNWRDKGGGGNATAPQSMTAGVSIPFTYWFYENGGGAWTTLYWNIGNGWEIVPSSAFTSSPVSTTTTTTTTLAPYFNPVINLQGQGTAEGGVSLEWDPPAQSNTEIYAYSITFFDLNDGSESGGWGIWTEETSSSLGPWMWSGTTGYGDIRFKVRPGSVACFAPSQYQCIYGPDASIDLFISAPTTTTTSTTTTSTTTTSSTTTTVVQSTSSIETTTTSQLETPQTSVVETTSTVAQPQTTLNQTTSTTQFLPETTTTSSTSSTIAQTTTTTSVPQNEDIELPETLSPEESVALATNPEILRSVTGDEAEQIFEAIDESSLTEEQAEQIIEAVQGAPTEVRETFEDTVDLFSGTFDSYEMVGQTISVGERRTIVAVNLVTATVAAVSATGGLGGGGGGGPSPSGGGGGPSDSNSAARKEDEEESEMSGEIAGDGVNWVGALSIYKIVNGEKKLNWKAFIKKFWFGVMNLGFTIAGSVVVYFTLSGKIQTIALVSTLLAFASAMYLHMKEPS